MSQFLDRECKAWRPMIENRSSDPKTRLGAEHATGDEAARLRFQRKCVLEAKHCTLGFKSGSYLGHPENKVVDIAIHEVPAIGVQLMLNLLDEIRRTIEMELLSRPANTRSSRSNPMK